MRARFLLLLAALTLVASLFAGPSAAATATVTANSSSFSPASVSIAVGDTVSWPNLSGHTVKADDGSFSSGFASSFTHTFETAGTFDYICTYRPYMKGTVLVE